MADPSSTFGGSMVTGELNLPSAGPEPIPPDIAIAAVLGYAHGRRPLYFRSPLSSVGRWVQLSAFGWEQFDRRRPTIGPLGEADIVVAESLHGRLDKPAWTAMNGALQDVGALADAAVDRAAGRSLWALPDEEFSVLAEPGTVGASFRIIWRHCVDAGVRAEYVIAALHHRHPELFPLLVRTTRLRLLPHLREGDSGVEAAIHRELSDNAAAFATLEATSAGLGVPLSRLRLHDILLWLGGSLRLTHAVELGRATPQWQAYARAVGAPR